MHYIIGLGNPGTEYEKTRHNIGRDAVLLFADTAGCGPWDKDKGSQSLRARGSVSGHNMELLLPETFMNKSGETVRYVVSKQDAQPNDFIVVYDDIDLPIGEIKISAGRGDGGHNGIKSITQALDSKEFTRIRIGIARTSFWTGKTVRPAGGDKMSSHVLGKFSRSEREKLEAVYTTVSKAIETIMGEGVETAMNQFN